MKRGKEVMVNEEVAGKRKPVEIKTKYVFKLRRDRTEYFIRAKEMLYFEHNYTPLTDTVEYFVFTPYERLRGMVPLVFLTVELKVSVEELREYVDQMWDSVSDIVAGNIITLSERDKTIPPETKDTNIIDISEEYLNNVKVCIRKAVKG